VSGVNLSDFLVEAEDLLDKLNHGLLDLDGALKKNLKPDPAIINEIFRAAHSLKGICGMFGFGEVGEIAHKMEDLLDRLRLGKLKLSADGLDALFAVTEELRAIISRKAHHEKIGASEIEGLKKRLLRVEQEKREDNGKDWLKQSGVSEDILSVLTEYEEHRLVENLREKMAIYQVTANLDLDTFDEELTVLQRLLKEQGELITTLPSAEASSEDRITFFLLLGTDRPQGEVENQLAGHPVTLRAITPGSSAEAEPATAPATAPAAPEKPVCEPEAAPEVAEEGELGTVRSLTRTVRVDIGKLDELMNIVGELVLSKNVIARLIEKIRSQLGFGDFGIELYKANRNLERKLEELQESVLEVRMVPIGQIYDKLRRNVRKLARDTDKDLAFVAEGGETELDKLIIEDLADPLMHIIRNAIDHGVEPREKRLAAGKPEQATIKLRALQRGNHVVIEISDDGAGLDFTRIRRKAQELGMIAPGQEVKEDDLIQFLFASGFSTAEKVSEISGRGVGLDVVKNNIGALSGAIDLESKAGQGTKVIITLPITLAIIQALVVEVGKETFAIPLNSVSSGLVVKPEELKTIEGREVIELRERTLPLLRLEKFFNLNSGLKVVRDEIYIVMVGIAERRIGLVVDRLLGRQDIVIKSIGQVLAGIKGVAGATELGDQRTILVLDVVSLIEEATTRTGRVNLEAHGHVS